MTLPLRADDAAVRKQIEAQYTKIKAAFRAKDVKGITSTATADFKTKEKNGQVYSGQQAEEQLVQMFAMMKSMDKVDMKVQKLSVKGNQAVATDSYLFDGKLLDPQTKQTHHMVNRGVTKDTWVKVGNTWKLKAMETIEDNTMIDGKKFDPAAMGSPGAPGAPPAPHKKK